MCEVEIHAIKPERHRRIYHFFLYFHELLWNLSPTTSIPLRILILQTCQELQIIISGFLFIHYCCTIFFGMKSLEVKVQYFLQQNKPLSFTIVIILDSFSSVPLQ